MPGALIRTSIAALLCIAVLSSRGTAQWVLTEDGQCMRVWTRGALIRGPIALINSSTLPLRFISGGVIGWIVSGQEHGVTGAMLEGPGLFLFMAGAGLVSTPVQAAKALAESATGGYFELVQDDEASNFGPVFPFPVDPKPSPDPCLRIRCMRVLPKVEAAAVRAEEAAVRASADAERAVEAAHRAEATVLGYEREESPRRPRRGRSDGLTAASQPPKERAAER